MLALIAGAGKTARELLRRIGPSWSITLVDTNESSLKKLKKSPQVIHSVVGDASSRVTLKDADLARQDYVVAVTNVDEVNLEVCRFAQKLGIANIIAVVNDSQKLSYFESLGVRAICGSRLIAADIELFLESPRLFVKTIAEGAGEIMEVQVQRNAPAAGCPIVSFASGGWLIAAIHRDGELIIPHGGTVVQADDRLTIVGRPDLYHSISHIFTMQEPSFPLEYGQQILIPVQRENDLDPMTAEALYLRSETRAQGIMFLASQSNPSPLEDKKAKYEGEVKISVRRVEESIEEALVDISKKESVGCVISPPKPLGPLARILGNPTITALAHLLSCPLLVSRQSFPYSKILVPCSGTKSTGLALEIAVDIANQIGAEVDAVTVIDPLASSDYGSKEWAEQALTQARHIKQLHNFPIGEVILEGNPVKEIIALADNYNLLVVGSTTRSASIMRPHIGEYLVQDTPCSVLVVT